MSPAWCRAPQFQQGSSTTHTLIRKILQIFFFFFNKYIDLHLGNWFSFYKKLVIREQKLFTPLTLYFWYTYSLPIWTGMLSQVCINEEYTQNILHPLAASCSPEENKIEAILFLQHCLFFIEAFIFQDWQAVCSLTSNWFYSSEGIHETLLHVPDLWNVTNSYLINTKT